MQPKKNEEEKLFLLFKIEIDGILMQILLLILKMFLSTFIVSHVKKKQRFNPRYSTMSWLMSENNMKKTALNFK